MWPQQLYLIHGSQDDNVHLQHSMTLAKELVRQGILFKQQVSMRLHLCLIFNFRRLIFLTWSLHNVLQISEISYYFRYIRMRRIHWLPFETISIDQWQTSWVNALLKKWKSMILNLACYSCQVQSCADNQSRHKIPSVFKITSFPNVGNIKILYINKYVVDWK